ncbi:MAG: sugar porter family MFS transporter [bacterium]|nr:sugar porter family MFS transporter [bacterium]
MSKNGFLILITSVAALGGLLFGYDTGVINGAQFYLSKSFELDSFWKGAVVSSALAGCFAGALSSGKITNSYGRKNSLIIAAILFTVSAWGSGLPSILPSSIPWLIVYRIIGGIGIGLASMAAPIYIAEIAPAKKRGVLVSFYQLAIVIGFFVVFLVTYAIQNTYTEEENVAFGWRYMFWSELIPCFLFLGLAFIIPKSPRWLIMKGREDEAREVLKKIHDLDEAEKEFTEIKESLENESHQAVTKINYLQKAVLPIIIIGTVLSMMQQFTGINAVLYYGADIFEKALGYNQEDVLKQSVMLAAVNFAFTFVAMWAVDKLGRKPLLLIGTAGMIAGFLLLSITLYFDFVGILSLIGILIFIGSFAMSLGPITWVMLSEMFPNKIRNVAMSVAVAAQWATNGLVTFAFPVIAESQTNNGPVWNKTLPYVIFMSFMVLLLIFAKKYLFETKGKSLEEIDGLWAEKYGNIE